MHSHVHSHVHASGHLRPSSSDLSLWGKQFPLANDAGDTFSSGSSTQTDLSWDLNPATLPTLADPWAGESPPRGTSMTAPNTKSVQHAVAAASSQANTCNNMPDFQVLRYSTSIFGLVFGLKDCAWFAKDPQRCTLREGDRIGKNGRTAKAACCACGGGVSAQAAARAAELNAVCRAVDCTRDMGASTASDGTGGTSTGVTVREGLETAADVADNLVGVIDALVTFESLSVNEALSNFGGAMSVAGAAIGVVTMFLPEQPSAELEAIIAGFKQVNTRLTALSAQMREGFAGVKELVVNLALDVEVNNLANARAAYYDYILSPTTLQYQSNFRSVCNDVGSGPRSIFHFFYSHGCSSCEAGKDGGWTGAASSQAIIELSKQDMHTGLDPAADAKRFKAGFGRTALGAMAQTMFLYGACSHEENDAHPSRKAYWLGEMKNAIDEVALRLGDKAEDIGGVLQESVPTGDRRY